LRGEDDPARPRWFGSDRIRSSEQSKIGLDELAVRGLEIDRASPADEAPVRRGESDDVGHLVGPAERKRGPARPRPTAFVEWLAPVVQQTTMRGSHPPDAGIGRLREAFRPALAQHAIYAYAEGREQR